MIANIILFSICAFFILQLDAYLYLLNILTINPHLQIVTTFFLLIIPFVKKNKSFHLTEEGKVMFYCIVIYICIQVFTILSWDTLPKNIYILFFWVYMILLFLTGYMLGTLLGKYIPYVLFLLLFILFSLIIIDMLFGNLSVTQSWGRPSATLRNPNAVGQVSVLLFLGCLRWDRLKWLELIAAIFAGGCIILSKTRGGMLDYIVLISCLVIFWSRGKKKFSVKPGKLIKLTLAGTLIVVSSTLLLVVSRYGSLDIFDALSDANGHNLAAMTALALIENRPLLGHGTGFVYTQEIGPHNMVLRSWLESGIPGLVGIMAIAFGLSWVGISRKDPSIIILIIVLAAISMTTHNLTEARSVLIITGILFANSTRKNYTNTSII